MEATLSRFGREHFGQAPLRDRRRRARLILIADRMLGHPGGTLPQKMSSPAELKALYRLMDRPAVTHAALLHTHCQRTLDQMRQRAGPILLIHDTTQLDYTGKHSLQKLGQIAKGFHRGYLCHNTLAVDAASGAVIGLVGQILHTRPRIPKKEPRQQRRERLDRESRLWKRGSQAVGPAAPGCTWIDICDRGGDLFEYLDHKHQQNQPYVVRSKHNRIIWPGGQSGAPAKLHEYARSLPLLGSWTTQVSANNNQPAREAKVSLSCAAITVPHPQQRYGDHGDQPLAAYVICVRELTPPKGVEALEWILLSNLPAGNFEEARQLVQHYARRPVIEEYHRAQKSGCGIELPQFTDESRLEPMIALCSVVAVQLLALRDAAKREDASQCPASAMVSSQQVRVLNAWRWKQPERATNLREFLWTLARLGGHLNRRGDGTPGWTTLWRGWQRLNQMLIGVEAMERSG